jgi:hypothetical protein
MSEGNPVFENRIHSVANLFQAGTQTIVYQAAPLPDRAPLLASLRRLDRTDQIGQLYDAVSDALVRPRERPLVIVLIGTADDDLLGFVQRVCEYDFPFDMNLACDYLPDIDWPEHSFHRMISQLTSAIGRARNEPIPPRAVAQEALVEIVANHGRSLAFAQVVGPDACRPKLIEAWTNLFARDCRNPDGGLLVCFLCLKLGNPQTASCQQLTQTVAALAEQHDWCLLDALPPLQPRHLEEWLMRYNVRPALPEVLPHIDTRIQQQIFDGQAQLRYRETVERLLDVLPQFFIQPETRYAA